MLDEIKATLAEAQRPKQEWVAAKAQEIGGAIITKIDPSIKVGDLKNILLEVALHLWEKEKQCG